jgi:magnesium transporter
VQAWRFVSGQERPDELSVDDALAHAAAPGRGDAAQIVWIDLEDPRDEDLQKLDDALHLGEFLLEDLHEGAEELGQRTKLLQHGDLSHVAVNDCSIAGRQMLRREIDLVFGRGWLCSVRHAATPSRRDPDPFPMAEVQRRILAQCRHERALDEGFLLWAFLDLVSDRYFVVTDATDDRLDDAETWLLDDADDADEGRRRRRDRSPRELFDIGRLLTQFRHQVIPLREVVGALLRREDPAIGPSALLHLRDVYDHLLGVAELVESQRDVLAGLRDVHLTVVSNEMNRSMQQLAAWGAILIVATLITGILGMNFRDQPDVSWTTGFVAVVAVIAVFTAPMYVFFKRRGWL